MTFRTLPFVVREHLTNYTATSRKNCEKIRRLPCLLFPLVSLAILCRLLDPKKKKSNMDSGISGRNKNTTSKLHDLKSQNERFYFPLTLKTDEYFPRSNAMVILHMNES